MQAHPFHIAAFCMTKTRLESSLIPESYILLQTVTRVPFQHSLDPSKVVKGLQKEENCCVLMVDNDGAIVSGKSLGQVFDRLEVLDATANVALECKALGNMHLMTDEQCS